MELRPREQQAERAEEPGERRHEDGRAAELLREPGGVDGPGAAVGDQRELARVAALLRRDRAQRARHPRVRDRVDAGGELERSTGRAAPRHARAPASASSREIVDLPVGDRPGGHVAEEDVRVGDGRVDAAAAVAGGPGRGAGAPRPDLQAARRVEPGDRAAARADLGDVDRRDPQQLAGAAHQPAAGRERAADLVLAAARDGAVLDQRRLRGRAAHVERDRVRDTRAAARFRARRRRRPPAPTRARARGASRRPRRSSRRPRTA